MDADDAVIPALVLVVVLWGIWEFEPLSAMAGKNTMYFVDSRCATVQGCDEWQSIEFRVYEDAGAVRAFSGGADEFPLHGCSMLSSDSWNCRAYIWPDPVGFDHGSWLSPHPDLKAFNWKTAWIADWFLRGVIEARLIDE